MKNQLQILDLEFLISINLPISTNLIFSKTSLLNIDCFFPHFTIRDAQRVLNKDYNETTDLLSELVKRKVISRLKRGKFLIIPQEIGEVEQYIGNWYVAAREVVNSPQYYIAFYSQCIIGVC